MNGMICYELHFLFPDIDECSSAPCMNGAVCKDMVADYFCDCPLIFGGKNCDKGKTCKYTILYILRAVYIYWCKHKVVSLMVTHKINELITQS